MPSLSHRSLPPLPLATPLSRARARARALSLSVTLPMSQLELSGGWRMKLALAGAILRYAIFTRSLSMYNTYILAFNTDSPDVPQLGGFAAA